jgi:hypothetical protein
MKTVKLLTICLCTIALILMTSLPSYAGHKQRYRWEGVGIALGTMAVLGTLYSWTHPVVAAPVCACPAPAYNVCPPPRSWVPGHWEYIREKTGGYWEQAWISGYYDRYGRWIPGHYIRRRVPGQWVERRSWIPGYYQ